MKVNKADKYITDKTLFLFFGLDEKQLHSSGATGCKSQQSTSSASLTSDLPYTCLLCGFISAVFTTEWDSQIGFCELLGFLWNPTLWVFQLILLT